MKKEKLLQLEKLHDIIKHSALKATGALSKLLEFPIGVDIVPMEVKQVEEIKTLTQMPDKMVGSYLPLLGDLSGASMLIYTEEAALAICDAVLHRKEGETKEFTQMEISAMNEVANIVIGNFLTSFSLPLKTGALMHRAADFTKGNFNYLVKRLANLSTNADGLMVDITFRFRHVKISGMAIFLFNEKEMKNVIEKLDWTHEN